MSSTSHPHPPNERAEQANAAVDVRLVDWNVPQDRQQVVELLDEYAQHVQGQGRPLDPAVRSRLLAELGEQSSCQALLAMHRGQAVGVLVAFLGYSTFQARRLLNIHDVFVKQEARNLGVGRQLLEAAERRARQLDCCRITLEVRDDNLAARNLYLRCGFQSGVSGIDAYRFLTKPL